MSGNEKDDGEEGRFELTEIQLSKDASGENNTSCASTLYDPSILALSTDHQAILEARYGRHNKYEEDSEKINAPFHIQSPSQRPSNSSPFGLHVNSASKTPYSSYSYGNEEGEESRTCCWGCLPLYASLIVVNIFNTIVGIFGVTSTAIHINSMQYKGTVGLSSKARSLISGTFILEIAILVVTVIFTLCGFFGIYIFYMRWKKSSTSCRVLGKFQLSLLVLVCFTSVAIFIANICGSAKSSSNNLVDSQLWSELVRSHPEYTCSIERRLKCAGFQPGHCKFSRNKRSNSNCAGHFCIDFCHISTRRVNMDTMCKACRRNPYKSIALFGTCKRIERKESDGDGCKGKIESDLRKSYKKLLTSSIIRCLCILLTLSVTLLPHCC